MNKLIGLVVICALSAIFCIETNGQTAPDHFTKEVPTDTATRTWLVFGAMTSHPDDSPLFVVDDIFHLQEGNGRSVRFKPVKMKNSEWKSASQNDDDVEGGKQNQGAIVLFRYPRCSANNNCPVTEYLCGRVKVGGEKHLLVISKMAHQNGNEADQDRITIEYEHAPNGNPNRLCENVVLPSHGGLAHAHATR
jgi:hypothetical protein